jgi:hypothetical protein
MSNARPQKDEEGAARCPLCSQNAHDETVLVRCAVEGSLGRSLRESGEELDALAREKARLGAPRVGGREGRAQLETNRATPEQGVISATRILGAPVLRSLFGEQ